MLDPVATRAQPYRLTAFRQQLSASFHRFLRESAFTGLVRNVTGRGDVFDATWQQSTTSDPSTRYSLGWRIPSHPAWCPPLDPSTTTAARRWSRTLRALDIRRVLDSTDLGVSQNLVETLAHKFTVGINRVFRENRTTARSSFSFPPVSGWRYQGARLAFLAGNTAIAPKIRPWRCAIPSPPAHNSLQDPSALLPRHHDHYSPTMITASGWARSSTRGACSTMALSWFCAQPAKALPPICPPLTGWPLAVSTLRGYRENQLIRDEVRCNVELDIPSCAAMGAV